MSTLSDVRSTLADALATVVDLEVYRYIPGSVNPPAAVMWPERGSDPVTFDQQSDARFTIRLLVQLGEMEDAQDSLEELLDTVAHALRNVASQVEWDNYETSDWGGVQYLSVDMHVDVFV